MTYLKNQFYLLLRLWNATPLRQLKYGKFSADIYNIFLSKNGIFDKEMSSLRALHFIANFLCQITIEILIFWGQS
jgi:hypothetical protein